MVKSIVCILSALLLLVGVWCGEYLYVNAQFSHFSEELSTLHKKVDAEQANEEDAKAIRLSWEAKKRHLHVLIPHNDISRVEDILAETIELIREEQYPLASAKIAILINLCVTVPGTYSPDIENIF